ncbi:MAG: ribonuclease HI family protein [Ktedonobacteraceae bacterium]|nr:ribonuclease HI family protein [Ktedonobacteraceae bacterium]
MNSQTCSVFSDGGSRGNPGKAACACVLLNPEGRKIDDDAKYLGITTNNQAEYEGLILALNLALKYNCSHLTCFMDSQLVVMQVTGKYKIKDEGLRAKAQIVDSLLRRFAFVEIKYVPREKNKEADRLVNDILDRGEVTYHPLKKKDP